MLKGFGILAMFVAIFNFLMYAGLIIVTLWAVKHFILS